MELPQKHVTVQVSVCRGCQSLSLVTAGSSGTSFVTKAPTSFSNGPTGSLAFLVVYLLTGALLAALDIPCWVWLQLSVVFPELICGWSDRFLHSSQNVSIRFKWLFPLAGSLFVCRETIKNNASLTKIQTVSWILTHEWVEHPLLRVMIFLP